MKFFDMIFGSDEQSSSAKHTKSGKKGRKTSSRTSLHIEPLEERQMLSAMPLASVSDDIKVSTDRIDIGMNLEGLSTKSAILEIQMVAVGNSPINPGEINVYAKTDTTFSNPLKTIARNPDTKINGASGSTIQLEIKGSTVAADNEYVIRLASDKATTGAFTVNIFAPGTIAEINPADPTGPYIAKSIPGAATIAQSLFILQSGAYNENTVSRYNTLLAPYHTSFYGSINYVVDFDYDGSGVISPAELYSTQQNAAANLPIFTVKLDQSASDGPEATFTPNDTLMASRENITMQDPTGKLKITDDNGLAEVWISFNPNDTDPAKAWTKIPITGDNPNPTVFDLDMTGDYLKTIPNSPVAADGTIVPGLYSLSFCGTDTKGNETDPTVLITFAVTGPRTFTFEGASAITIAEKGNPSDAFTPLSTINGYIFPSGTKEIANRIYYTLVADSHSGNIVQTGTTWTDTRTDGTVITLFLDEGVYKYTIKPGNKYNPPLTVGHEYGTTGENQIKFTLGITDIVGNATTASGVPDTKQPITATVTPFNNLISSVPPVSVTIDLAAPGAKEAVLPLLTGITLTHDPDKYDVFIVGDTLSSIKLEVGVNTYTSSNVTFNASGVATVTINVDGTDITFTLERERSAVDPLASGQQKLDKITLKLGNAFRFLGEGDTAELSFSFDVKDNAGATGCNTKSGTAEVTIKGTKSSVLDSAVAVDEAGSAAIGSTPAGWEITYDVDKVSVGNFTLSAHGGSPATWTIADLADHLGKSLAETRTLILACLEVAPTTGVATFTPNRSGSGPYIDNIFSFLSIGQTATFDINCTAKVDGVDTTFTVTVTVTGINNAPTTADYNAGEKPADATGTLIKVSDIKAVANTIRDLDKWDVYTFTWLNGTEVPATGDVNHPLGNGAIARFTGNERKEFTLILAPTATSEFYHLQKDAAPSTAFKFSYIINDETVDSTPASSVIEVAVKGVNKPPAPITTPTKSHVEKVTTTTVVIGDWFDDPNTVPANDTLTFKTIAITATTGMTTNVEFTKGVTKETNAGTKITWNLDDTLTIDSTNAQGMIVGAIEKITFNVVAQDQHNVASAEGEFKFEVEGTNQAPVATAVSVLADAAAKSSKAAASKTKLDTLFTDPDKYNAGGTTVDAETYKLKYYVDISATATPNFVELTAAGIVLSNGDTLKLNTTTWEIEYWTTGTASLALLPPATLNVTFTMYAEDPAGLKTAEVDIAVKVIGVDRTPTVKDGAVLEVTVRTGATSSPVKANTYFTDPEGGNFLRFLEVSEDGITWIKPATDAGSITLALTDGTIITIYGKSYPTATLAGTITVKGGDTDGEATFKVRVTNDEIGGESAIAGDDFKAVITTGPSFDTTKAEQKADYGGTIAFNIPSFFKGVDASTEYRITSRVISDPGGAEYKNFLDADTITALKALPLNTVLTPTQLATLTLVLRQYSWNLDTTTIEITLEASNGPNAEDKATGTVTIAPTVQHSVYFSLTVTSTIVSSSRVNPHTTEIIATEPNEEDPPQGQYVYYLQLWVEDRSNIIWPESTYRLSGITAYVTHTVNNFGERIKEFRFNHNIVNPGSLEEGAAGYVIESTEEFYFAWLRPAPNSAAGLPNGGMYMQAQIPIYANETHTFELSDTILTGLIRLLTSNPESDIIVHPSQLFLGDKDPLQSKTVTAKGPDTMTALVVEDTITAGGIYMRTVANPTATDAFGNGNVSTLPKDADWIHEWQTHYVELWVKASEAGNFAEAFANLKYDTTQYTAVSVELGAAFGGITATIDDAAGLVNGIGGFATDIAQSKDGYILLGRVKFMSLGTDNVPAANALKPASHGLSITVAKVTTTDGEVISKAGLPSATEVWAVPFDANDDGTVGLADFAQFIKSFGKTSTAANPLFTAWDADKNGKVDLSDFSQFIKNFGLSRAKVVSGEKMLKVTDKMTQRYVGSTLVADDPTYVSAILTAANNAWATALGVEPMNVQIFVRDFGKGSSTLGETMIVSLDSAGKPVSAIITLDNDAAGLGWYSQLTDPVVNGRYDLYTVLLHELGHAYGLSSNYAAYNYTLAGYYPYYNEIGHATNANDVMYYGLNPGERKYLTSMGVGLVSDMYTAVGNFSNLGKLLVGSPHAMTALEMEAEVVVVTSETIVIGSQSTLPPLGFVALDQNSVVELERIGLAIAVAPTRMAQFGEEVARTAAAVDSVFSAIEDGDGTATELTLDDDLLAVIV